MSTTDMKETNNRTTTGNRVVFRSERATLYSKSEFLGNYRSVEVRNLTVELIKYAQYPSAVQITFTPKGARRERVLIESFQPSAVVVEGWGHAKPRGAFDRISDSLEQSRYRSCSPAWGEEFAAFLAETGLKAAFDARGLDPHAAEKTTLSGAA